MRVENNKILFNIPITGATSKIRIKRRINYFGEPLSTKTVTFDERDYLEWQISYFLPLDTIWDNFRNAKNSSDKMKIFDNLFLAYKGNTLLGQLKQFVQDNIKITKSKFKDGIQKIFEDNNETIIIKPHKNDRTYVNYELSDMFKLALRKRIVSKEDIMSLINFNEEDKIGIEEDYKIKREKLNKRICEDFECFEQKAPLFINKTSEESFVEIILSHKQKAVGYQSMVFFCIYLRNLNDKKGEKLIGRCAEANEIIEVSLSKEELLGIARSFIVASKEHNWDMKKILKDIIKD